MIVGEVKLPKMDGLEVKPGVFIIGEPSRVPGTNKLIALADMNGCLVKIELSLKFQS
jgi:hypothetical protein